MQKPKRNSSIHSPWGNTRLGRYSLEEIALEFILWEDADKHTDAARKNFINQALDESFGEENRGQTLCLLFHTYERLYEKIYQCKLGNRVKEDRATPESIRQLFNPMNEKQAA
jgi:hypothetical protein